MKQKLKKLKLLLTISLAGLLLNSCQEEFDESYNESKNHNLVKEYTFKQASQKPKFNNAYQKFEGGLNRMKMTNKSEDSDFTIDSTTVKEITLGNQTTYTMAIKRPTPNSSYFENLIVQVKNGDSTRAYISKYTPTKEMVYYQEHNSYTFEAASEIKEIVFDTSAFQNKITLVCFSVMVCDWGGTVHIAGEHCSNISDGTGCFEVSSGDSSGPGDGSDGLSSSGGGTSSSGGSSSGGVPTAPVPPPCTKNCPEISPDPCITLTPLMPEPKIANAINFLKPKTQTKSEFGFEIEQTYTTATDPLLLNTALVTGSAFNTTIQVGGFTVGQAHNHPILGGAIPSWGDLNWTMLCEENNAPRHDGTAFNLVVVADPQLQGATITYAVTINDLVALEAQMALDFALPGVLAIPLMQDKFDFLNAKQAEEFKNALTSAALEKKYLEYFSKYGVNLAKFDPIANKWNKLKLQNKFNPTFPNAPNTVLSEPCN